MLMRTGPGIQECKRLRLKACIQLKLRLKLFLAVIRQS
jgi:hypothetical protein